MPILRSPLTPDAEPAIRLVSRAEAKAFLRVDGSDDDALIDFLIDAALSCVEDLTWSTIELKTWQLILPFFPGGGDPSAFVVDPRLNSVYPLPARDRRYNAQAIRLPRGPVRTVTTVAYIDSAGIARTILSPSYQLSLTDDDALLAPLPGASWPSVQVAHLEPVVITYTAGGNGDTYAYPLQAKQAVLMIVSHWFERREALVIGTISKEMELGVKQLCRNIGLWRFDGGR